MLKKRVIPTLLLKDKRMVKGKKFQNYKDVGDPISAVRIYNNQHADELMFIDINKKKDFLFLIKTLKEVSKNCFIPLCAGGGIETIDQVKDLLRAGADKILVTTAAYKKKDFIRQATTKFGQQCLVIGIDLRLDEDGKYFLSCNSGNELIKDYTIQEYIKFVENEGAGEIVLNFIDHDGMMGGVPIEVVQKFTKLTKVPIIILGGIGNFQHVADVFNNTSATAVACSSIFHFGSNDPIRLKSYLKNNGIEQRSLK